MFIEFPVYDAIFGFNEKLEKIGNFVISNPFFLRPEHFVHEAEALMAKYRISGVPICDNEGKLVGILTNRDLRFEIDFNKKIGEVMTKENLVTAPVGTTLEESKATLRKHRVEKLPLVDANGKLGGLITIKDIEKSERYPNAAKDEKGRLLVGAAVGTSADTLERVDRLVKSSVDVLVVDTAHGHSVKVLEMISSIN